MIHSPFWPAMRSRGSLTVCPTHCTGTPFRQPRTRPLAPVPPRSGTGWELAEKKGRILQAGLARQAGQVGADAAREGHLGERPPPDLPRSGRDRNAPGRAWIASYTLRKDPRGKVEIDLRHAAPLQAVDQMVVGAAHLGARGADQDRACCRPPSGPC